MTGLGGWTRGVVVSTALVAGVGCQGGVPTTAGGEGGSAAGMASASGGAASAGSGGMALDPGRKGMHRLNTTEYNATVQDVLGTKLRPADGTWQIDEFSGFDNQADGSGINDVQFERYFKAAQALAAELMASSERARFVKCELTESGCARSSIERAGLRIFRRPLSPDEVATYLRVFDSGRAQGDDEATALTSALVALLSSAEFVYRIELDPNPDSSAPHPLGAYELATRLSYFLWSSAPDESLLAAAADDSLGRPEVLAGQATRLLGDERADRFVESFAGQWLGARLVPSHPAAPQYYQWDARVAQAASREIQLFFAEFVNSERSWFEFPTADVNYIDGVLAPLYAIPTKLTGYGNFERVEYAEDQRFGFFGLAGFLALTSFDRRTSPSKRGRWVLGNLLCQEPPPPMNTVNTRLPADDAPEGEPNQESVRAQLERHRSDPTCAACHALFDPYGLALEQFDAVGVYRTTYPDGSTIDASTEVVGADHVVIGLADLADLVSKDPRLGSCLARKLFTYGLGRRPSEEADQPHLEQMQKAWLAPGEIPSVSRLIQALVGTEAFRFRRGGK